ncbi:FAD-binding oxidoreductase [Myxococcota bacterium]
MDALTQLREMFGSERVLVDAGALAEFSGDMTENPEAPPDAVVRVESLEQLQAVVRLADGSRTPLVPRVAGTNLGGLTIATRGGWIVDLTAMNRIVELNEADCVAVVEPGVTFGQMRAALDSAPTKLTIGYPLSPPESSVAANCLLDGLGNLSLRHGAMGQWITGLEVVRADGSLLRTGAWALGAPVPFGRAPLPDLTGLFLSWQGTTGIVSKLGIELWPCLPFRERSFVLTYDRAATFRALRELPRLDLLNDMGGLSWPTSKMLLGVEHPRVRDPAEPEFFFYLDLAAATEELFRAKRNALRAYVHGLQADGLRVEDPIDVPSLVRIEPRMGRLADFPTRLDFLLDHPDGGLSWVGTYGPMSHFETACERGIRIVEGYGFPPTIVARPMKGGHFAVLRFIQVFRRGLPEERERVRCCHAALCDALLQEGYLVYKTPGWAVERYRSVMDPGFARLLKEVRHLLDPHHLLNPGRWEV